MITSASWKLLLAKKKISIICHQRGTEVSTVAKKQR